MLDIFNLTDALIFYIAFTMKRAMVSRSSFAKSFGCAESFCFFQHFLVRVPWHGMP